MVCRSVCQYISHYHEPCKSGWTDVAMPFKTLTRVGPRNHVLDGSPDPSYKGAILRGWQWDFPTCHQEPFTVPWRRDFPTCCRPAFRMSSAEAVECHIKFSQWKIPPSEASCLQLISQRCQDFFWTSHLNFHNSSGLIHNFWTFKAWKIER